LKLLYALLIFVYHIVIPHSFTFLLPLTPPLSQLSRANFNITYTLNTHASYVSVNKSQIFLRKFAYFHFNRLQLSTKFIIYSCKHFLQ